jgi:hypothetical protein
MRGNIDQWTFAMARRGGTYMEADVGDCKARVIGCKDYGHQDIAPIPSSCVLERILKTIPAPATSQRQRASACAS